LKVVEGLDQDAGKRDSFALLYYACTEINFHLSMPVTKLLLNWTLNSWCLDFTWNRDVRAPLTMRPIAGTTSIKQKIHKEGRGNLWLSIHLLPFSNSCEIPKCVVVVAAVQVKVLPTCTRSNMYEQNNTFE
jgi:hypothetical protein